MRSLSIHSPRRSTGRAARASIAVLVAVSLAACAGGGSKTSTDNKATGPVELAFWNFLTGSDKPTIDKMIADFNASQTGIKVVSTGLPGDVLNQKLLASVASGEGPDIVSLNGIAVAQYAAKGALQPTDDFFSSTKYMDTSALVGPAVEVSKVDGKNYGVPLNLSTMMLYWNKTLFQKAGLSGPPTTVDEFAAIAPKLTIDKNNDGKPEQYAIAMADHETVPMFQPALWAFGGGVVSADGKQAQLADPETLQALEFWVDQVRNKKVSPLGADGATADKLFLTGKAAMEIVGPWMAPAFAKEKIDFGVAPPLAGPAGMVPLADTVTFGLTKKAGEGKRDAAFQFFAYWNSKQAQKTFAEGTGFPSTRTDFAAGEIAGNPYPAVFGDSAVTSKARVYMAQVANGQQINDTVFVPALQRALNGEGTVRNIFTKANVEAQELLDSNK